MNKNKDDAIGYRPLRFRRLDGSGSATGDRSGRQFVCDVADLTLNTDGILCLLGRNSDRLRRRLATHQTTCTRISQTLNLKKGKRDPWAWVPIMLC